MPVLGIIMFFFFYGLQVRGQSSGNITVEMRNVPLTEVLAAIEKQSGLPFVFNRQQVESIRVARVSYQQKTLTEVLDKLLSPLQFGYKMESGSVILFPEVKREEKKMAASYGKITGKIIDEESGEPISGATVLIENKGTSTDIDGFFAISFPKGIYTARVSYTGYGVKEINDIDLKNGQVLQLDITLKRVKGQLSDVVVKASAGKATAAAVLLRQRKSIAITDGISAELIRRTPDRNAGDALKRVTGVSVLENKYVVVRGLSDKYNYTMLNGGVLPSTEPDRRTFSLDLIPALAIESIVVVKTANADLPGEFAGGVVQVTTRDFPEENFLTISMGGGFYEGQTGKPFFKDREGKKDWLGYDDGGRAIPRELDLTSKQFQQLYPEERFKQSNLLSKGWAPIQSGNAKPIEQLQLGYGKTIQFKNKTRLGIIALGNYRRDQTIDQVERYDLARYVRYQGTTGPGDTLGFMRLYPRERDYRYLINEGLLLNIAYQFGNHKISVKTMLNRDFETVTSLKDGAKTLGSGLDDVVPSRVVDMHPTQKTLLGTQLQGEHKFGLVNPVTFTWNLAYNKVKKYEPNQTRLNYANVYYADTVQYQDKNYFRPEFGTISGSSRLYTDLKEDAYNVNFAVSTPFTVAGQPQVLKAGSFSQFRKREYLTRNLGFYDAARGVTTPNDNQGFPSSFPIDFNQPIDQILSPGNYRPGGLVVVNYELPANEYTGGANLASAFVNMESNILKNLKMVYGARVEFYTMSLSTSKRLARRLPGSGGSGDDQSPIDYIRYNTDVLPSASLIYNPIPSVNVRAAYSKTLTRPEFREVSPYEYYDFVSGFITKGNPELNRGTIRNLDFRVEWFPAAGEIFSASIFKKDLKDPIEITTQATSNTADFIRTYKNVDAAKIWGLEFEFRKSLYFGDGPEWLRNITLFGNYSRIHSAISGKADPIPGEINPMLRERPLMGQSPYLLNAGMLVNAFKNTFSFSAALNRSGRRILVVGTTAEDRAPIGAYPDVYENPRNQLDIQIGQKLFRRHLEIRLNAANLINNAFVQYQDFDLNRKYSGNLYDATVYSRRSYRNYTLTLTYTFKK